MAERKFNPWLHRYYQRFVPDAGQGSLGSVAFLIGSPDISGGTYVIFQHALWLKEHGVDVTVIPTLEGEPSSEPWHPGLTELTFTSLDEAGGKRFDLAIATWWRTVYDLPRLRFRHATYFVQSMEPRLEVDHSADTPTLAELTYTFGLPVITIALWMQAYLAFQHDAPSFLVRNGIDKGLFTPSGSAAESRGNGYPRVLIEGAVESEMKGVEEAIQVARDAGFDDIWLLTPSDIDSHPGVSRVWSRVPTHKVGDVYRSCDVLLKLSNVEGMYGPPLEMFHCGGTVVTNDVTGHDEFIEDGFNALIVPTDDIPAARGAMETLLRDQALLARLSEGAGETAERWPSWEQSSREFERILRLIARQPARDLSPLCREILGAAPLDRMLRSESSI